MSDSEAGDIGHHAEEDENYFVSMTDMMVGILFVFIILLMVFALNMRDQTDESQKKIEQLKQVAQTAERVNQTVRDLQVQVSTEIDAASASAKVKEELLTELQRRLDEAGLEVSIDVENGVLRLNDDAINFPTNQSELQGRAAENVSKLAAVLAIVLPQYLPGGGARQAYIETVFIEGHTDSRGTGDRNWTLSTERAVRTFWALISRQPSLATLLNRQDQTVLSAAGYADSRPIPDVDRNDYDRQRRIDLRFVMDSDNRRLLGVHSLTTQIESQLGDLQTAVDAVDE